ncbi:acetate--CoA ligase family protein [Aquincola sp. S2]|uniref:Acetate--CoA ligase family protein n=1 Tax=Pseudaquabacterium terrae TaxID=2732868 RepID=A0ABX2EUV1_9BURK|nr:acetate--CoA ligase family protein [Aquabacterium terrae]NRF72314.1 acetate--CoA ligase family protein [Aquabacterium terrae]
MNPLQRENLHRLLKPRHVAVFGGRPAAEVVRQCRRIGFAGEIWPVHPRHVDVEGLRCFRSVADLPQAPDASFIALPRESSIEVVAALAARGAGGAVCYASGFAEVGAEGAVLQARLVSAAQPMALIGPNCYGVLNLLDGAALWPDQHGARRVERGVAIVAQSGNIGINVTMQRRGLPIAYLITLGNQAGTGLADAIDGLLDDPRVTAIGLHIEGLGDAAAFSRVALRALERGVPLVALKCGGSAVGAQIALSHTSSLAGADALCDAFFRRFGIARVHEPVALVETLKLLHVHGALPGRRIASASCSGGEAALVADLAEPRGLQMPALPAAPRERLQALLGDKVNVTNPLDYHTYIWGDLAAQTDCFAALMDCRFDLHLLLLDLPRADRCSAGDWQTALDAFIAAQQRTGAASAVVSSLPEGLPEPIAERLVSLGIAPLQGEADALDAVAASAAIGEGRRRRGELLPIDPPPSIGADAQLLDEWASKQALARFGVPIPRGEAVAAEEALACAEAIGYPVVIKAVSPALAHKTEAGAVCLNLQDAGAVREAVERLSALSKRLLVETMQRGAVAELIVGVNHDPQFGLALTLGAGGVLVELLKDSATLLLPATREHIRRALMSLRIWPLLVGYRGRAVGDIDATLNAIEAVISFAQHHAHRLHELDVNPLLVLPQGRGVVAVDALIRLSREP